MHFFSIRISKFQTCLSYRVTSRNAPRINSAKLIVKEISNGSERKEEPATPFFN